MTDEELRRLAEAATPGVWFVAPNGSAYYGSEPAIFSTEKGRRGQKICSAHWGFGTEGGQADYYFIAAANPAAIIALLDRVERAEAREREARRAALEEAAKVAEKFLLRAPPYTKREAEDDTLIRHEMRTIAKAIRDLAKEG